MTITKEEELTFDYENIGATTTYAWLIKIDDKNYWLPKKGCKLDWDAKTIFVPKRLAIEKGLV